MEECADLGRDLDDDGARAVLVDGGDVHEGALLRSLSRSGGRRRRHRRSLSQPRSSFGRRRDERLGAALGSDAPVGKRLDPILQEILPMLRKNCTTVQVFLPCRFCQEEIYDPSRHVSIN